MANNTKHYKWSTINRLSVQLIGFLGNILVARQLSPDDYGLIAMLSIIIGIAWNLTESGFGDYLIRKRDADKYDFATIFAHNTIFGLSLYAILYFSAPYIAQFFQREELVEITRILSLSIFFKAVSLTEFTRMRKELMFKNSAIIQILANLLSVSTSYILAINGFGYWALVWLTLSLSIYNILLIVIINKWKPVFYFNWSKYKTMRGFSNNMLLSYFMNQIGQNLYTVFIGKYQPTADLGFYNQGKKINDASVQGVNSIILTTSYSIIAKEPVREKRAAMYRKIMQHFFFVHFLMCFYLIGSAEYLMEVIFGEQWIPVAPYLIIITFSFLFYPFNTINSNILKTENKSNIYRNLTFVRNLLFITALLFTYKGTVIEILTGQLIARYISFACDIAFGGKRVGFMPVEQLKVAFMKLIAPCTSMVAAFYSMELVENVYVKLLIFTITYFAVNVVINLLLKDASFLNFKGKILSKISK